MSEKIEDVSDQFYKQEIHFSLDFFMESDELGEILEKHGGTLLFDGTAVNKGIAFEYLLDFVNLHIIDCGNALSIPATSLKLDKFNYIPGRRIQRSDSDKA